MIRWLQKVIERHQKKLTGGKQMMDIKTRLDAVKRNVITEKEFLAKSEHILINPEKKHEKDYLIKLLKLADKHSQEVNYVTQIGRDITLVNSLDGHIKIKENQGFYKDGHRLVYSSGQITINLDYPKMTIESKKHDRGITTKVRFILDDGNEFELIYKI